MRLDAFEPLGASGAKPRIAATTSLASASAGRGAAEGAALPRAAALEIGVLVHRALQAGIRSGAPLGEQRVALAALLRPQERALADDPDLLVERAIAALTALGENGLPRNRMHEVPFSLQRADGTIVRGTIDAIVEHPDGRVEVIEFKTGRARPGHQEQLAIYVEAARALYPTASVEGRIIYAEGNFPTAAASN
jgi:RecB family exonuclease